MNDEAIDDTHEEGAAGAPVIRELELRPHPKATHWQIARAQPDGSWERLPFRVSEAGEAIHFAPIDTFSAAFVRTTFGPGRYRINWRATENDSRRINTLGNDELTIVAPPAPREGGAPRASSVPTMTCQGCGADLLSGHRFCAVCGTPAGARAAAAPAPAHAESMLIDAFTKGAGFREDMQKSAADIARAEADERLKAMRAESEERIKRYEIDQKSGLERERMAHDKAMAEQRAWFERMTASAPKVDPDALVAKIGALVKEEMSGLEARLAQLEERLEEDDDDDDDEPEPAAPPATPEGATWNDRIEAAGKFVDKVGAPLANAIGDAYERITKKNGAASNAEGGSGSA